MSGTPLTIAKSHDVLNASLRTFSVDRQRPTFTVDAESVTKLEPGTEQAAIAAAKKDGADNVFVQIGKDTWCASGRGLDKPFKAGKGDTVTLFGDEGKVIATDYQTNSFRSGAKLGAFSSLGVVAAAGVTGTILAAKGATGFLVGLAKHSPKVALGVAAVTLGAGLYGALRTAHYDAVETFGKH